MTLDKQPIQLFVPLTDTSKILSEHSTEIPTKSMTIQKVATFKLSDNSTKILIKLLYFSLVFPVFRSILRLYSAESHLGLFCKVTVKRQINEGVLLMKVCGVMRCQRPGLSAIHHLHQTLPQNIAQMMALF